MLMSRPAVALSARTASGSKAGSMRVRALCGSSSVDENTTFSAPRQISA
jgi:hypothetical protein